MDYEWDPAKSETNLNKHGISFDEARYIFDGPTLTRIDDREDYGEQRYISLGSISREETFVVVHTEPENRVRLISARKANRIERKVYRDHLEQEQESD